MYISSSSQVLRTILWMCVKLILTLRLHMDKLTWEQPAHVYGVSKYIGIECVYNWKPVFLIQLCINFINCHTHLNWTQNEVQKHGLWLFFLFLYIIHFFQSICGSVGCVCIDHHAEWCCVIWAYCVQSCERRCESRSLVLGWDRFRVVGQIRKIKE